MESPHPPNPWAGLARGPIPVFVLVEEVGRQLRISPEHIRGPRRTKTVVAARQLVMILAREATVSSLQEIGQELGGRHHTTVMHGAIRGLALIRASGLYRSAAEIVLARAIERARMPAA